MTVNPQRTRYILSIVKKNGTELRFINSEDATYQICLEAVKNNGLALKYAVEHHYGGAELFLAAVQQNGCALEYVQEQTPEICMAAVQEDGWALQFVKEQTPAICMAAVQQNAFALKYVKDLHSIADKIDELTITKGLNYKNEEVVLAYQKLVKIHETNVIANRMNKGVDTVNHRFKVRL